ncbi:MAG: shikimate dehydrogenase [Clostridia bacterium]|nr:shikimate dehydrogenase [Clostridia bacterium]
MQYGLIGRKLGHSFSKEIHEKIENYTYSLKELEPQELDDFMTQRDFKAINVTIPYKEAVIPYLDNISAFAKNIGAVNTIVNRDGKLYGYNTDCLGLKALIARSGIELRDSKVLILGTGGTSKTAAAVAYDEGASIVIRVSRSKKDGCVTYDEMYADHSDADVIINTTPCGMYPDCQSSPAEVERFSGLKGVIDVIYNPLRTSLVSSALAKGIKASGGLYMLVAQAVFAAEKFTGKVYDKKITDDIYDELEANKENIVLTGMPASGKSTVGTRLALLTGRRFIDTDDMIVKAHNMEIPDIFSSYGEDVFRSWEAECVKEASQYSGCIIATGGGVVLRPENVSALGQTGRIYFLDRPLGELVPTSDRPLAQDAEAIRKRYEERYSIYTSTADEIVAVDSNPEIIARRILASHTKGGKSSI